MKLVTLIESINNNNFFINPTWDENISNLLLASDKSTESNSDSNLLKSPKNSSLVIFRKLNWNFTVKKVVNNTNKETKNVPKFNKTSWTCPSELLFIAVNVNTVEAGIANDRVKDSESTELIFDK